MIICFFGIAKSQKDLKRIERVEEFKQMLIDMSFRYNLKRLRDPNCTSLKNAYEWFCDKYTFEELLESDRPLTLEEWYTQEEINEIRS